MDNFLDVLDDRVKKVIQGSFMKTIPALVTAVNDKMATVTKLSDGSTVTLLNMSGTNLSVGDEVQVYSCGKTEFIGASRNVGSGGNFKTTSVPANSTVTMQELGCAENIVSRGQSVGSLTMALVTVVTSPQTGNRAGISYYEWDINGSYPTQTTYSFTPATQYKIIKTLQTSPFINLSTATEPSTVEVTVPTTQEGYDILFALSEIAENSGGSSITVDSALSSSSTNPVQNKVINTALNDKQDKIWAYGYDYPNGTLRRLEKALSPHTGSLRFKPQQYGAEWVDMGMRISTLTKGTAQVEWHIGSISVTLTNGNMVSVPIPTFTHAENFIRSVGGTARNTLTFTSDSQRFVSVNDGSGGNAMLIVETVSEMLFNWTSGYVYFTLYITVHPYYPLPASADQMYIAFDTASYNASATNASAITSLIGW